jgi:predicted  nucleic acid-binding Zn-ribbon protein
MEPSSLVVPGPDPSIITDPQQVLQLQQYVLLFAKGLYEKTAEDIARLQRTRGQEERLTAQTQAEREQARTELVGLKGEIEGLRRQKNDTEVEIAALSKQRADIQSDVEKLKVEYKRYRGAVDKEFKHFAERVD